MNLTSIISSRAEALLPEITKIRRDFHQHPEFSFEEYRTSQKVAEYLNHLGLEVKTGIAKTGVIGILEGKYPGPTFAIRADMDALPITEESTHDFISLTPGMAHLCGHDGHTSNALGVAMVLSQLKEQLAGRIKFIFQPAEEVFPPGGASEMVKEGVLQDPDVNGIVMLHVDPTLPIGKISLKYGRVTGTSDEFSIKIIGEGGHGAMPHLSVDPIIIACQVAMALQTIVSRNVDPIQAAVISIGSIHAGQVFNAIPDVVHISGTVRTIDNDVRNLVRKNMEKISNGICESMGATCEFSYIDNCGATINADVMVDAAIEAAKTIIGKENIVMCDRVHLWTEDFSCYAEKVPGVYFSLGTAENDPQKDFPLHHPRFNFDESALLTGIKVMSQMAVNFLKKNKVSPLNH